MTSRKRFKNVAATRARRIKKRAPRTKREDVPRALNLGAVERLYASGLIERNVAAALGVSESTLARYKRHPAVMTVVQAGRKEHIGQLIHSTSKRARGYEYAEVTMEPVLATRQVDGEKQTVLLSKELAVTKIVTKHMPPDISAAEFLLTNLDPENFKRKVDVTSGGQQLVPASFVLPGFGDHPVHVAHGGK
jgi:hypothetical protein